MKEYKGKTKCCKCNKKTNKWNITYM